MDTINLDDLAKINLYDIMDVSNDFSNKELKKNYKYLAKKFHPDKKNGDAQVFQYISLAYSVLKNTKIRDIYDKKRYKYLNGQDNFNSIKEKFQSNNKVKKNISKKESKKLFKKMEKDLNLKHGYNEEDTSKIDPVFFSSKLNNHKKSRINLINNFKSNNKELNLSKNNFNDYYIKNVKKKKIDNSKKIVAYNDDLKLSKYNSINNFDLYSDYGISTKIYSSIKEAYNNKLQDNIKNEYNTHNIIPKNNKKIIRNGIDNYNNLTRELLNKQKI